MPEDTNNTNMTRRPRRPAEIRLQEKAQNFDKLAEKRVTAIFEALRKLGNLANKGNYEYTSEDIDIIFSTIQRETSRVNRLFKSADSHSQTFDLSMARIDRHERK